MVDRDGQLVVLGGGLDSDWIPENERDGCVGVSIESQTTNPNHQETNS